MLSKDTIAQSAEIEIEQSGGNELQVLSFEGD
jgi:hypothetical protein